MTELNTIQYWVAQYQANLTHCAWYTCKYFYWTMQMWYKFQVIFLPDEAYWTSFVLKSSLENSETWTGTNIDSVHSAVCCSQCTEHNALSAETTIWFAQNCPQEVFVTCQPMCFNILNRGHGLRLKIRTMDHSLGFTYRIVHMAYLGLRYLNGH